MSCELLPDGGRLAVWDDRTVYTRTYHVAQTHPCADDANPGSTELPWRSIARAAAALEPGERVVIHAGTYRECVVPARGGSGPEAMIHYQAAAGESVLISAADPWVPADPQQAGNQWIVALPLERFVGYQPFLAPTLGRVPWFPWAKRPVPELMRGLDKRGRIFHEGRVLRPVSVEHLGEPGCFRVSDSGEWLAMRLFADADPAQARLEISVRESCFRPARFGLGWIRVSGLVFAHAANGIPMPQRGALSTHGGHHWIIEDCTFRDCTSVGADIGLGADFDGWGKRGTAREIGGHRVRRNRFHDIGCTGLCGTGGIVGCLVEGNQFTRIGGLHLEHAYEMAAIKFHFARDTIIRGNAIRHLRDCCGIWLDYECGNCRVSGNLIADIETLLAGIYIEANLEPNLVDANVVTDMRDVAGNDPPKDGFAGGNGIVTDVCDHTRCERNLLVGIRGHFALAAVLAQKGRVVGPRSAFCRGIAMRANLVIDSPKRMFLARTTGNAVDGNAYAGKGWFGMEDGDRIAQVDLKAWREFFAFDRDGCEPQIAASIDCERGEVVFTTTAPLAGPSAGGPLNPEEWATLVRDGRLVWRCAPEAAVL